VASQWLISPVYGEKSFIHCWRLRYRSQYLQNLVNYMLWGSRCIAVCMDTILLLCMRIQKYTKNPNECISIRKIFQTKLTRRVNIAIFWDIAPYSPCMNRRFGIKYHLHLQGRNSDELVYCVATCFRMVSCSADFRP
jgi:hypothetical protein